jgi:hypothetical protein
MWEVLGFEIYMAETLTPAALRGKGKLLCHFVAINSDETSARLRHLMQTFSLGVRCTLYLLDVNCRPATANQYTLVER